MKATAVPARRHIRAAALAHYFEVCEVVGLNTQPLLRRAGLSRRMLVDPEQRIPLAAALRFYRPDRRLGVDPSTGPLGSRAAGSDAAGSD